MKVIEFNKMLKAKKYMELISKHMQNKIYLTDKQLDKVLEERDKGEDKKWKKKKK